MENEKNRTEYHADEEKIMKVGHKPQSSVVHQNNSGDKIICFSCNKEGHKSFQFPNNRNHRGRGGGRYNRGYGGRRRANNNSRSMKDEDNNSIVSSVNVKCTKNNSNYLIDSGATSHIINDKKKIHRVLSRFQ